ncbi:unnamed protein product [Polarella glacialis]|uniref:Uncharacterized protein n=1 Tax=Polarella glacialis TaxID=89957 RepID=A0A813HZ31_POLGL|nr:unnamed protein product [Polarella glacialis]CAE8644363.1 unnamed protein product [Polarella glacialis]|mmetsp:Transcript_70728/g.113999  ORF Transcript_70728/g.113999 Transcript_70728/m.113999 type:complete len:238 (+) Transcript_70728:128-841(+)
MGFFAEASGKVCITVSDDEETDMTDMVSESEMRPLTPSKGSFCDQQSKLLPADPSCCPLSRLWVCALAVVLVPFALYSVAVFFAVAPDAPWDRYHAEGNQGMLQSRLDSAEYTFTAPGAGACDADDYAIWDKNFSRKFQPEIRTCATPCFGGTECTTDCFARFGYSKPCAKCFGILGNCGGSNCLLLCSFGDPPPCQRCVDKHCKTGPHSFWNCSGLPKRLPDTPIIEAAAAQALTV